MFPHAEFRSYLYIYTPPPTHSPQKAQWQGLGHGNCFPLTKENFKAGYGVGARDVLIAWETAQSTWGGSQILSFTIIALAYFHGHSLTTQHLQSHPLLTIPTSSHLTILLIIWPCSQTEWRGTFINLPSSCVGGDFASWFILIVHYHCSLKKQPQNSSLLPAFWNQIQKILFHKNAFLIGQHKLHLIFIPIIVCH